MSRKEKNRANETTDHSAYQGAPSASHRLRRLSSYRDMSPWAELILLAPLLHWSEKRKKGNGVKKEKKKDEMFAHQELPMILFPFFSARR